MIEITERMRPFVVTPGESCLIPRSTFALKGNPARLEICSTAKDSKPIIIDIEFTGPANRFYLFQDLLAEKVLVRSESDKGLYEVEVFVKGGSIWLGNKRKEPIQVSLEEEKVLLERKAPFKICQLELRAHSKSVEKLSLGKSKALDWQKLQRRKDFCEVFPVLFHLGQITPEKTPIEDKSCESYEEFRELIESRFISMNVPTSDDLTHQGVEWANLSEYHEPTDWMAFLYRQIRALFLQEEGDKVRLLPKLFRDFDRGKLSQLQFQDVKFSLEWSKDWLKTIFVTCSTDRKFPFFLPKGIKECRIWEKGAQKGEVYTKYNLPELKGGIFYAIDRFRR